MQRVHVRLKQSCLVIMLGLVVVSAPSFAQQKTPAETLAPATGAPPVEQQPSSAPRRPEVLDLGAGRILVGNIVVDKELGEFRVPGRMLKLDTATAPIEFLAAARSGDKGYESALELDVSAFEFNLACILIGLTENAKSQPYAHFDPKPVEGDPVDIRVSWRLDGRLHDRPVGDLIKLSTGTREPDEWSYTGSAFNENGSYRAQVWGTLIGVVHDPDSIIHHRTGLGLNDYGAVIINHDVAPPPDTRIVLTVRRGS